MKGFEGPVESPLPQAEGQLWELRLAGIVQALRNKREASTRLWRRPQSERLLPSARALRLVIDKLSAALHPHCLGPVEMNSRVVAFDGSSTDSFVGHALAVSLLELREQIALELALSQAPGSEGVAPVDGEDQAARMIGAFAGRLPTLRSRLDLDLQAAFQRDPAASSLEEVLVCNPGIRAIIGHRFAHELHTLGAPIVARIIAEISHSDTGVDIHPAAVIGDHFFIDHGMGVVIGGTARIGNHVRLHQAVTLGAKHFPMDKYGHVLKGQPRYPIVKDHVVIYSGVTLLGCVTIGRGSTIGANVWLTSSVPPGSVITQALARHEQFVDGAGI